MLLPPSRTTSRLSDTPLFMSTENFDLMARSKKSRRLVSSKSGLVVVHRNSLAIRDISLPTGFIQPQAFEMQLVRITSSISRSVVLANIYRPPRCSVPELLDELADVVTSIYTASNDRLVLCGDVNCPGFDGTCVDDSLALLLDSL